MTTVLITGAGGFIARHLAQTLRRRRLHCAGRIAQRRCVARL